MQKSIGSKRQEALVTLLIQKRKYAGLNQSDVAKALGEHQSFIARIESGQRRIDVVEYLALAEAIGFDPVDALRTLISNIGEPHA